MKLSKFRKISLYKIGRQLIHFIFRRTSPISTTTTTNRTGTTTCGHRIDSATAASSPIRCLSWSARYSAVLLHQWNEIRTTKDTTRLFVGTILELRLNVFIQNCDLLRSTFVALTLGCNGEKQSIKLDTLEVERIEILTVN